MTKYLGKTRPTKKESLNNGAEIVFHREGENGEAYKIFGAICYESWEQWGVPAKILSENVPQIEEWRKSLTH